MAEEQSLPGWPKKKLVKDVRRHLSLFGIRPARLTTWQAAWTWANAVAHSGYPVRWPLPSEIATLYLLLVLADMHESRFLRLPFRAKESLPPDVAAILPVLQQQGFPPIEVSRGKTRKKRRSNGKSNGESSQQRLFQDL